MLGTKKVLTLAAAKRVGEAAAKEAVAHGLRVAIAIVDDGGHLLYFERLDGTQPASVDVAIQKSRGALLFKRSTKVMEDLVAGGRTVLMKLAHIAPLEGGLPLEVDGEIIGAIGVSGVTSVQDGQIAQAGLAELGRIQGA